MGDLKLQLVGSPHPPYELPSGRTVIGRGERVDFYLPDQAVSRRHCVLENDGQCVRIADVSRNGLLVNGTRLAAPRCVLAEGDQITIGPHRLAMVRGPAAPSLRTETTDDFEYGQSPPSDRAADRLGTLVGTSEPMRLLFDRIRRYAATRDPVLILGETGTGKEGVAQALHACGPRARGPFVPLNVGLLSRELVEVTLFGCEKGAFTGADRQRDGLFHRAHGGTLFLDEFGEIPLELQPTLLRALESGEVRRLGSLEVEHPDVRVVVATHQDLERMCEDKRFRSDLWYRVSAFVVHVPPLRDRRDDLPVLVDELLARDARRTEVMPGVVERLAEHHWPGNVRELRGVLHRAIADHPNGPLIPEHLFAAADRGTMVGASPRAPRPVPSRPRRTRKGGRQGPAPELLRLVQELLVSTGSENAVAKLVNVSRSTIQRWVARFGLMVPTKDQRSGKPGGSL